MAKTQVQLDVQLNTNICVVEPQEFGTKQIKEADAHPNINPARSMWVIRNTSDEDEEEAVVDDFVMVLLMVIMKK